MDCKLGLAHTCHLSESESEFGEANGAAGLLLSQGLRASGENGREAGRESSESWD